MMSKPEICRFLAAAAVRSPSARCNDRARFGAHGTLGASVVLAPGLTEAFELVGSATGSFFPNDGKSAATF